jgi:hypothetical protein
MGVAPPIPAVGMGVDSLTKIIKNISYPGIIFRGMPSKF